MICFDAVGTLIYPFPDVASAYSSVSRIHGCCLSAHEIGNRFRHAFDSVFGNLTNGYECVSSEIIEREKWRCVVQLVFKEQFSEALFEDLWTHFSLPENWKVIPETAKLVSQLTEQGAGVSVASNFDQRIVRLMQFHFPQIDPSRIFYSTELGFAKPDVRFYKEIEKRMAGFGKEVFQGNHIMIGDTFSNDYETAIRAGWTALFLDEDRVAGIGAAFDRL